MGVHDLSFGFPVCDAHGFQRPGVMHEHGQDAVRAVLEFVPWKTFGRIVERHQGDAGVRTLGCAELFRVMAFAQLSCRQMACPEGLEPPTCCLEGSCSIQLSYGQRAPDSRRRVQRRWYCCAPNSASRALSSVSGLRRPASTSTPRLTAGRAAISSNQPFRCGKSSQSMLWFFHERSQGKVAMSAIEYSGPPR